MNYEQMNNNRTYLCGTIETEPIFSHDIYGEGFFDFVLSVERLSGQCDLIPITISDRLLKSTKLEVGSVIAIKGQFRSYNKQLDNKSKLMLTVFVRELVEPLENFSSNIIELGGFICKEPIYRTTPFKREICDILLAVNRAYNKSDYLPCIAWGRNARFVKGISIGDKVYVQGRIQSRDYQKKIDEETIITKTAFEISISKISLEDNIEKMVDSDIIMPSPMELEGYSAHNSQGVIV